ncbi:hypothetical protein Y032_0013g2000 [Ancylostoma ceylanicum]|uniref:Uncharacterized protein n=1 Tax=Ancylostoma ceylanicum TaxID=53326 RepID=A0A016VAD6_9BILA|nr:hypothetical protein Y032_0013g2000 [Ancylostoma ceylanicum]
MVQIANHYSSESQLHHFQADGNLLVRLIATCIQVFYEQKVKSGSNKISNNLLETLTTNNLLGSLSQLREFNPDKSVAHLLSLHQFESLIISQLGSLKYESLQKIGKNCLIKTGWSKKEGILRM